MDVVPHVVECPGGVEREGGGARTLHMHVNTHTYLRARKVMTVIVMATREIDTPT